jgi:hypothetical protein
MEAIGQTISHSLDARSEPLPSRPLRRAECPARDADGRRRCAHLSCAYHLAIDIDPRTGALRLNVPYLEDEDGVPDVDLDALEDVCALDAAEHGGMELEAIGRVFGVSRERVRQIEARGVFLLRQATSAPWEGSGR